MVRIHLYKKHYPLIDLKKLLIITSVIVIFEFTAFILPFHDSILKTLIIRAIDILIIFFCLSKFKQEDFFFDKKIFFSGIKKGLIFSFTTGLIFFVVSFLIKKLFDISIINFFSGKMPTGIQLCTLILAGGIISPIAEEFYFRGILFNFFKNKLHIVTAIFFSSLIFAITHNSSTQLALFQFTGGILFAMAYHFTNNIYVPIIIHSTGNIFIFIIPMIQNIPIFSRIL